MAIGQAVWTVATSFGIAELIQASEPAFLAMRTVGAAYLLSWAPSPCGRRGRGPAARRAGRRAVVAGSPRARSLRQGVVNDLANPKMAAFFLSLLPQFASPEQGVAGVLLLGLLFCLLTFAWLALYSAAVARARVVLGAPVGAPRPRRAGRLRAGRLRSPPGLERR